jgi:hypothetical protein
MNSAVRSSEFDMLLRESRGSVTGVAGAIGAMRT